MGKRIAVVLSFFIACYAFVGQQFVKRASAAGFQLFNEISARGTGMGAAMTAVGDSADTAWFNPAATAFLDRSMVQAGTAFVVPSIKLEDSGNKYEMKNMVYPLPNFYAVMPTSGRVGFSFAVNVPYGLTTEWHKGWIGDTKARKTELRCMFFTPSMSIKLTDWLSLGVGAQVAKVNADMTKAINALISTRIKGKDIGKGYVVSLYARPSKDWNLGMVFRSHVKFHIYGSADYDSPSLPVSAVNLPLTLPASLSVGVSTTSVENWLLSCDFLWTWWSYYKSLDFHYEKLPTTGLPGESIYPKNWKNCMALRFGAEYRLNRNWRLRGSYVFDQSPIQDNYRDPSLPTNDRHLFSVGAGYYFKNLTIDGAYTCLLMKDSHPGDLVTPSLSGTYKGYANIFNLSATWVF